MLTEQEEQHDRHELAERGSGVGAIGVPVQAKVQLEEREVFRVRAKLLPKAHERGGGADDPGHGYGARGRLASGVPCLVVFLD